tara:strand:+ start:72 stop:524 length:453 start_codon:yes stop_codon:yes gene_type:complete
MGYKKEKKNVGEELEEKVRRKNKGGQGNRGRKPKMKGPPKGSKSDPPNKKSNGGSKSTTSNKAPKEDNDAANKVSAAKDLSDTLAEASHNKVWRQAGIKALVGKEVSANEGDLNKGGLDTTLTGIGYNSDNTGPDMGQMDPKKRKEEYGF